MRNFIAERPILADAFFHRPPARSGALAVFLGVVRDHHKGRAVLRLRYECYASMANKRIDAIRKEAESRFGVDDAKIAHRVGTLEIGETALAVAVSAAHRAEAFAACEWIVEEIKRSVPVWKKEFYADGTSEWTACAHESARLA